MENSFLNPKSLKAVILHDALKHFLYSNKTAYNISKIKLFMCFINDFCDFVIKTDKYRKFETRRDVKQALADLGIDDVDGWLCFLTKNKEELLQQGFKLACFHLNIKKDRHAPKNKLYNIDEVDPDELDEVRDVVVRSKFGNYPVKICRGALTGPMSSTDNVLVNEIKLDYVYDTGCPYYEVRPILYSTWAALPEDDPRRERTCDRSYVDDDFEDEEDF